MVPRSLRLVILTFIIAMLTVQVWGATVVPPAKYAGTPIEFGLRDLKSALVKTAQAPEYVKIFILLPGMENSPAAKAAARVLPKKSESFVIARDGNDVAILGRDQTGAMYGCLELAERLDMKGRLALDIREPVVQSPKVEFRAVNPFLTLPYGESEEDWWFLKDDYWEGYLDQLARARINWVDLHGMYDVKTTWFPNIYPYFITSEKFPEAGAEPEIAKRNLAMLNKVIAMAKERGIKFALMSYSATWNGPGLRPSPYKETEENLAQYTREVVRKIIEQCPGLDMIGFRIGESGKSESFFRDSYIPAIKEAGRPIDLYARTWVTSKPPILEIGENFPGRYFIEIKYNGEQFGPPYIVAGGRMKNWHSYSYQDYYSYPKNYKIIYQLRANGTHRVFPWGNPEYAARANQCSTLGGAIGLCVEQIDSYYPKHDYKHRDDSPNRWYRWNYERDWFYYTVWGRTAYDPSLKYRDELWTRMFARRYGKEVAAHLFMAMKSASKIVPDAFTSYGLGPDHRNHAPELEWGGNVKEWADRAPFDVQNIQTPNEFADRLINGDLSARANPLDMAQTLTNEANTTRGYVESVRSKVKNPTPEINDLLTELTALSYLADYYSHRLAGSVYYALMRKSNDLSLESKLRAQVDESQQAWSRLAAIGEEHYKPFVDTLRMHTENFTWTKEGEKLQNDTGVVDDLVEIIKTSGKTATAPSLAQRGDVQGPQITGIKTSLTGDKKGKTLTVTAAIQDPGGVGKVLLGIKPLPSERDWTSVPMNKDGNLYQAEVPVDPDGLMWRIEALDKDGNGSMWPDFRQETPYRVVLPWETNRLMPGQALSMIGKLDITNNYSLMIAGKDAAYLDSASDQVHADILKQVEKGTSLVIMCQNAPDIWRGKWLPGGIEFTDDDSGEMTLVSGHPVTQGLPEKIKVGRAVVDGIRGGDVEWIHLTEPNGVAVRKHGKGYIILLQVPIDEHQGNSEIQTLFRNAMRFAAQGSEKPALVIEPGNGSTNILLDAHGFRYDSLDKLPAE